MQTLLAWQLVDSAFPSGGFAHSWGLEAACQAGEVADERALWRFVQESLWQAGYATLPLVNAAHASPARLDELDAIADAFLTNHVANRASRVQGKALVSACARIWSSDRLRELDGRGRLRFAHQGPVAGAVMQLLGVPLDVTQRITLFVASRGVLAAAVRLGTIGPYRAQQLQHACGEIIERVLAACSSLDESSLAQTAPLVDVLQASHDRLYSRLFQS